MDRHRDQARPIVCLDLETMLASPSLATFRRTQGYRRTIPRTDIVAAWMLLDGAVLAGTGLAVLWFRREAVESSQAGWESHCVAIFLMSAMLVCVLQHASAYELGGRASQHHLKRVIPRLLSTIGGLIAAMAALGLDRHFAVPWAGLWLTLAITGLAIERVFVASFLVRLTERSVIGHRIVIAPAVKNSLLVERRIKASGDRGLVVVGFVDDRPAEALPACVPPERVVGGGQDLMRMIYADEVDEVVFVAPLTTGARLQRLLMQLTETTVRVSLVANLASFDLAAARTSILGDIPVVRLSERPIAGLARVIKRMEDLILAPLFLFMTLPLFIVIPIAIKLDSSGPVLFHQTRVGFNDRPFTILKFRTMYTQASDVTGKRQVVRNDLRITRVGAWLRKTSIDELPQLLNVLRGEMSLVGPRPHAPGTTVEGRQFQDAVNRYAARHRVKPGMTGWAQVNGWRGETDVTAKLEERLRHDLYYVENWSVWFDMAILARTLLLPFHDHNAY